MKVTYEAVKFWILEPMLYALALIGVLCVFNLIEPAEAAEPSVQQMKVHAAKVELRHELPPGILSAVCEHESHWRNVSGRHGEIGVCQLKPDTVRMICNCGGYSATVFYMGATGDAIKQIQAELTRWGMYDGAIDGVFGPLTDRAVRKFQTTAKLAADGVVGPVTWATMFRGEAYPGQTINAELWNPYKNIEWAAAYLVWLRDNVSSEPAVMLAAYNGGPANPVVQYVIGVQKKMARVGL